ncbi:hypothetical protein Glove_621g11 [Diversispora epigaea]|uniref:Protein kinase domain-containing protein n=1 Tax=Diversispora epigaea TaxID=1348612 RepID=A0A397GBW3_9GLOM|nr:hypothetical protein Glove_621g11 [Diversispora epigaea]
MSSSIKRQDSFKSAVKHKYIKQFDYNTFQDITRVGAGGFGTVYCAYSPNLEKHVALKRLNKEDELFYEKFVRELTNIMAVNNHDNIINFYGISIGPPTETYFLVLQYAKDGDLKTYLRKNFKSLDWTIKINMAKDITSGLRRIHKENIVHKDLHSMNILVHERRLLITDLGLSQSLDSNSNPNSNIGGMIAYTDPEYLRNHMKHKRNKASDIYSLGVLFWELSSGRPPFNNLPSLEIYKKVLLGEREDPINETPKDYIDIYSSAWNNDPHQRPTIESIFDSLKNINYYDNQEDYSSRDSISITSSCTTSNLEEAIAMKDLQESFDHPSTSPSVTLDLKDSVSSAASSNSREVIDHQESSTSPSTFPSTLDPKNSVPSAASSNLREVTDHLESSTPPSTSPSATLDPKNSVPSAAASSNSEEATDLQESFDPPSTSPSASLTLDPKDSVPTASSNSREVTDHLESSTPPSTSPSATLDPKNSVPSAASSNLREATDLQESFDPPSTSPSASLTLDPKNSVPSAASSNSKEVIDLQESFALPSTSPSATPDSNDHATFHSAALDANDHATSLSATPDSNDHATSLSATPDSNDHDNMTEGNQIKKYNYNDFENRQNIGKGICSATLNGTGTVALKSIVVAATELFDNELEQYSRASSHENIIGFYGISQKDSESNEYTLVLEYANGGTLRDHLKSNFETLEWIDKLNLAQQIVKAIEHLHSNDVIHGDLHPKNILLHDNTIKIGCFGISKLDAKNPIEYSDPMLLEGPDEFRKNKASDIYSIGILLWEISSGKIPYESKFQDESDLIDYVSQGNREDPIIGTPQDYINIYQDCWNQDPDKRPIIVKVVQDLEYLLPKKQSKLRVIFLYMCPLILFFFAFLALDISMLSGVNEPFSTVINKEHVTELSSWIDRKSTTYSLENNPYKFQLILRGSRDGFHPKTFWYMCNGHAGTIVVAKVAGTDEIVGGYNPLAWDNSTNGSRETNDSFIFSLKNGNNQNSILSKVKDQSAALFYLGSDQKNAFGPMFGNIEFIMKSKEECWCSDNNLYYEKPIRTTNEKFSIVDYEVFKIIKIN